MPLSRRSFLKLAGLSALVAATGCKARGGPETEPSHVILPETPWSDLSAEERINRLELHQVPNNPEFDQRVEILKATAEIYCQHVPCPISANEIVARVHYLSDPSVFLEKAEANAAKKGIVWDDERREQLSKEAVAFTSSENEIYVNTTLMDEFASKFGSDNKDDPALKDHDPVVRFEKKVYLHEFGHLFETEVEVAIEPIVLADGKIIISQMRGLEFYGKRSDGSTFLVSGAKEASTDYVAWYVSGTSNQIFHPSLNYWEGTKWINQLNNMSDLTPREYVDYYLGIKPLENCLNVGEISIKTIRIRLS